MFLCMDSLPSHHLPRRSLRMRSKAPGNHVFTRVLVLLQCTVQSSFVIVVSCYNSFSCHFLFYMYSVCARLSLHVKIKAN